MREGKRGRLVKVYCSDEEYAEICAAARGQGLSASAYARSLVVRQPPTSGPRGVRHEARRPRAFKASNEEWEAITGHAAALGISASSFIRRRCLHGTLPIIDRDLLAALRYEVYKLGVNANQIAHRLNAARNDGEGDAMVGEAAAISEMAAEAKGLFEQISAEISMQEAL